MGAFSPLPNRFFSCVIFKRRKTFSSCLVTFPKHSLRWFQQRQCRVRSSQVTKACLLTPPQNVCNHNSAKVFYGAIFSYQVFIAVPVCVICVSLILYLWPEVRSESWSLHHKPTGKYWNASCFEYTSQKQSIFSGLWRIMWPVMTQVPLTDSDTGKGHLRPSEFIFKKFLANKSRYDGAKDLVPNCSPGHDALIDTQNDFHRSNFEADI